MKRIIESENMHSAMHKKMFNNQFSMLNFHCTYKCNTRL